MITTSILYCLLLVLPTDLQTIVNDLGSDQYKIRKKARSTALSLSPEKKRLLIKELSKSSDPELSETAKELKSLLPGALNKEKILNYVLKGKYDEVEKALKLNPTAFKHTYDHNMNIVDIAKTLNKTQFVKLFESAGLKGNGVKLQTMDVLVVETDTWQSLAKDFNTKAQLIMLLNKDKMLKPGVVIKIPRGN